MRACVCVSVCMSSLCELCVFFLCVCVCAVGLTCPVPGVSSGSCLLSERERERDSDDVTSGASWKGQPFNQSEREGEKEQVRERQSKKEREPCGSDFPLTGCQGHQTLPYCTVIRTCILTALTAHWDREWDRERGRAKEVFLNQLLKVWKCIFSKSQKLFSETMCFFFVCFF